MITHYLKNLSRSTLPILNGFLSYYLGLKFQKGPLFVNWDITGKCNARCIFCDRWKTTKNELSTKEKLEIIKKLGKSGVWFLSLCGGEPLLTKDLELILKEIKKHGMLLNISTNGLLLREKMKLLIKYTDFITVSIQSADPKIHDFMLGQKNSFERTLKGIKVLKVKRKNKKPKVYGRVVLNSKSLMELREILNFWRKYVDEIFLQPICENKKMLFKAPFNLKILSKHKKYFKDFYQLLREFKCDNMYNQLVPLYIFKKHRLREEIRCFSTFFFLTLDEKGNVYSCSARRKRLGNLLEKSLTEILNSERTKKFRRKLKKNKKRCFCWHSGSMLNVYLSKFFFNL